MIPIDINIYCVRCNQLMNQVDEQEVGQGSEQKWTCGLCDNKIIVRAKPLQEKLIKTPGIKEKPNIKK